MQWALYDTADPRRRLLTDPSQWRALLQFLCDQGIIDDSRAGRLVWYLGGEGTSISASEAHAIAAYIQSVLLPSLSPTEGLRVPAGRIWFDAVTTPTLPPGLPTLEAKDAVLAYRWVESFGELCAQCTGLGVILEGIPSRPTRA